ncbi:MAG: lytic murein transglycosylase B [Cytophagales bacterium CG12_big_fil_rev_8_21_14_0_65_40_12]|nr:MAG: lytic murein transglycosylase B [Cytophagales bacterium CG12_big_fil_rev_8_21_14_0_65_40_12]PIW05272.1 MAG: lytic murein transglycosylase B [Cytophagales bacterium CG17_big_fil_post_rev_8_21_14_2_50_40_13]
MQKTLVFTLFAFIHFQLLAQIDQAAVKEFAQSYSTKKNVPLAEIEAILNSASYKEDIIAKISKPAEGTMTWGRYRKIFITDARIDAGVTFWEEHKASLAKVSAETGVPEHIILGIIGVETYFGKLKGSYKVLDALYTLGFGYPARSKFFKSELEAYLVLAKEEKLDIDSVKGSYAGAMGYSQFMPSSYRAYAKSFEENGTRDLINSPEDAIASVANYLKVHKWKKGEPIASKATMTRKITGLRKQSLKPKNKVIDYTKIGFKPADKLEPSLAATMIILENEDGEEHWFGMDNFYVITRYNHSPLYAMAVYQLGEAIKAKIQ